MSRPATRAREDTGEDRALWVFVLGDMTVFALFFVVLLVEHRRDRAGVAATAHDLALTVGLVNTVVLLTGSYLVVLATSAHREDTAHREGAGERTTRLLAAATASAGLFTALKVAEYAMIAAGGGLGGNATFAALYYVVTGLHLLHVLVGAVLLRLWWRRADRGEGWSTVAGFAGVAAVYWHMVDLLWLVIFSLVYLVGRAG